MAQIAQCSSNGRGKDELLDLSGWVAVAVGVLAVAATLLLPAFARQAVGGHYADAAPTKLAAATMDSATR